MQRCDRGDSSARFSVNRAFVVMRTHGPRLALRIANKEPTMKLFFAFFPVVLAACAIDATEPEQSSANAIDHAQQTPHATPESPLLVSFCLPGEKRVCTLGPPPVCHCEPEKPPVLR
jgi:hypothetical protein